MNHSSATPIRVMVVDDSAIVRGMITRQLATMPGIEIVAVAENGQRAVDIVADAKPQVVILDIEMPVMDGITALPLLLKAAPQAQVLVSSTLSLRNAEISLKAMSLGAADYLAKPNAREPGASEGFFRELHDKIHALSRTPRPRPTTSTPAPAAPAKPEPVPFRAATSAAKPKSVKAIAIASSTGGPQALNMLFSLLGSRITRVPIFITQHMPPSFTTILAEHLAKASGMPCHEAIDGEKIVPGTVYLAPGDYHMLAVSTSEGPKIQLNQAAPENFCRPAADPMLRSLAAIYGNGLLSVVLTGMGQDGLKGCQAASAAGGYVIAQDQASSVVWGMPRAVAEANVAQEILPLNAIPEALIKAVML
jgi:two-component system, chemotaxis family, protein-glutamate methylesterase/glutaminase